MDDMELIAAMEADLMMREWRVSYRVSRHETKTPFAPGSRVRRREAGRLKDSRRECGHGSGSSRSGPGRSSSSQASRRGPGLYGDLLGVVRQSGAVLDLEADRGAGGDVDDPGEGRGGDRVTAVQVD